MSGNLKPFILFTFILTLLVSLHNAHAAADNTDIAKFTVTNKVINKNLTPFTATINSFGNGSELVPSGSGFEPIIFRTRYTATENSINRIITNPKTISQWDTLKSGALDGADVDIYRIINKSFSHVRRDYIPKGGFNASGWIRIPKSSQVVKPDVHEYTFAWARWNKPKAPYYFTVKAIDRWGNLSAPAVAISALSPSNFNKKTPENSIVTFKALMTLPFWKAPEPPTNLKGQITSDNHIKITWDPSRSTVAGYIIYRSDTAPQKHKGYYIDLSKDGPEIKAGDIIIVRKKFYSGERERLFTNRAWNVHGLTRFVRQPLVSGYTDQDPDMHWILKKHKKNTSVDNPGETYVQLTLGKDTKTSVGLYNHSGTSQDWYPILEPGKPYIFDVWLRSDKPRNLTFLLSGFYYKSKIKKNIKPIKFNVSSTWKKYTYKFTPPILNTSKRPSRMEMRISGPGRFDIDNFRVYRADVPYLDYSGQDYKRLKISKMSALRTHAFVKTRQDTYDLEQLTNPGGVISGIKGQNTLPQTLNMLSNANMRPWLQIEPHFTKEEWLGLVEYLAATYDPEIDTPQTKPWAWKRYRLGRKLPWIDSFDKIYFEIGNETWNHLFRPWVFPTMKDSETGEDYSAGTVYGLYQEYVLSIMRESQYWSDLQPHLITILGGWSRQNYGKDAAIASPSSDYMTIAAYNGGWDEGEGPVSQSPSSFFNILNQISQSSLPATLRHNGEVIDINKTSNRALKLGTYEAGPGYSLNGLNKRKVTQQEAAAQELSMKSLAAGTATLDGFLSRATNGFALQNFFTYSAGTYWSSHARWENGGASYPSWELLSLFNREALGDVLKVETIVTPTANLTATRRRKAVTDAPLISAYATLKEKRLSLILISRRIPNYPVSENDGTTSITIKLPFKSAKSLTQYYLDGTYKAHNVFSQKLNLKVKEHSIPLTLPTFNVETLPPGQTYIYVFNGIEI